jgi:hypothetical protein
VKKPQRLKRAAKKTPAAAGVAKAGTVTPAAKASPPSAAPAPREVRVHTADAHTDALVGTWKLAHVDAKKAELAKDLARSPIVLLFKSLDLDVLKTSHGSIVAAARVGEIDYKALAVAELGAERVQAIEEAYRKAGARVPTALTSWCAEAGL